MSMERRKKPTTFLHELLKNSAVLPHLHYVANEQMVLFVPGADGNPELSAFKGGMLVARPSRPLTTEEMARFQTLWNLYQDELARFRVVPHGLQSGDLSYFCDIINALPRAKGIDEESCL